MKTSGLAWITGGGSGIGRALALALAECGWQVVISGRDEQKLKAVTQLAESINYLILDVTDKSKHKEVWQQLSTQYGIPQLTILNAGDYKAMPAEQFDLELVYHLNQTNYLGVINGLACVLPALQARQSGQILIISSVAGYCGLPDAGPYGATKAALINLAESLHHPLKRQGVKLRVVNPGFVSTPLTAQNQFPMPGLMTPEQAAERIINSLERPGFEITFPKRLSYTLKILRWLPYRWYFWLTHKMTGK